MEINEVDTKLIDAHHLQCLDSLEDFLDPQAATLVESVKAQGVLNIARDTYVSSKRAGNPTPVKFVSKDVEVVFLRKQVQDLTDQLGGVKKGRAKKLRALKKEVESLSIAKSRALASLEKLQIRVREQEIAIEHDSGPELRKLQTHISKLEDAKSKLQQKLSLANAEVQVHRDYAEGDSVSRLISEIKRDNNRLRKRLNRFIRIVSYYRNISSSKVRAKEASIFEE